MDTNEMRITLEGEMYRLSRIELRRSEYERLIELRDVLSAPVIEDEDVVRLFNPYHDRKTGKFTTKGGGASTRGGTAEYTTAKRDIIGRKKKGETITGRRAVGAVEGAKAGAKTGAIIGAVGGGFTSALENFGAGASVSAIAINTVFGAIAGAAETALVGAAGGALVGEYNKSYLKSGVKKGKIQEDAPGKFRDVGLEEDKKADKAAVVKAILGLQRDMIKRINAGEKQISYPGKIKILGKLGFTQKGGMWTISANKAKALVVLIGRNAKK